MGTKLWDREKKVRNYRDSCNDDQFDCTENQNLVGLVDLRPRPRMSTMDGWTCAGSRVGRGRAKKTVP